MDTKALCKGCKEKSKGCKQLCGMYNEALLQERDDVREDEKVIDND